MTKIGSEVTTTDGKAIVIANNMLKLLVKTKMVQKDGSLIYGEYKLCDVQFDKKNVDVTKAPVAEIIVAKNRHGSTGTVKLHWIGRYTTFYSIEEKHGEDAPPDYGAPPPVAPPAGM
jgi:hypothetical protein